MKKRSLLAALSLFFFSLLGFLILVLCIVAIKADVWHFVLLGIGGFLLCTGVCITSWSRVVKTKRIAYFMLFIGFLPQTLILPYSGTARSHSPIKTQFLKTKSSPYFGRIPEVELVRFGETFGWKKQERSTLGEDGVWKNYSAIVEEENFDLPSSHVLDSWFIDRGHYWISPISEKPKAILVFLHGGGGNFKAYPHWFHKTARKQQILSIYPTWGLATWSPKKLAKRIKDILHKVKEEQNLSDTPVYLCGLSAGSIATLKMLGREEISPDGFISLSGYPSDKLVFIDSIAKTPSLFIHGAKDTHLPVEPIRDLVKALQERDAQVTSIEYKNDDHTLLHQRHKEIVNTICQWIHENLKNEDTQ